MEPLSFFDDCELQSVQTREFVERLNVFATAVHGNNSRFIMPKQTNLIQLNNEIKKL